MADAEPKLVLIVDDDDSVREMLEFIIRKEGFRVESAADGEEGAQKAEKLFPDLIVLDLMLPRYGGFELLRRLQGGEQKRIPIVVVTGRYTDRATADLIRQESNVAEFLEKPVRPAVLGATLQRIIGGAGARKA
jgi:CheY-like chemotaxis protein